MRCWGQRGNLGLNSEGGVYVEALKVVKLGCIICGGSNL